MKKTYSNQPDGTRCFKIVTILCGIFFGLCSSVVAAEINEKLAINGVIAGTYQYHDLDDTTVQSKDRGGFSIQPEISYRPTDKYEFFAKLGFGAGKGLNEISPFVLAPWAANLEDDVKNINGRNRDYLLTAWLKCSFKIGESAFLGITGGLIDATDYLDSNAFANDEYTQFMNEALVNGPNGFFPSFDAGGAMELEIGNFSVNGVIMNIGENDDGENYNYYGVQIAYLLTSSFGEGNYRLIFDSTGKSFWEKNGLEKKRLSCAIISFDQQFGNIFGAWIRAGRSENSAMVDFQNLLSGGINISGKLWSRENDNMGIGVAFLNGGNTDLDKSNVAEAYIRFALGEYLGVTADVQYIKDQYGNSNDPNGFVYGLRLAAEF